MSRKNRNGVKGEGALTANQGQQQGGSPERQPEQFSLRRSRIKTDVLIADLRRFAQMLGGRPFKATEFNAWPERRCSSTAITSRFGKWNLGLAAAGIQGGRGREYSPEELMAHLAKVWRTLGRPPGVKGLRQAGPLWHGPYTRHWGSLRNACFQLARYHRAEISWEEALRPHKHVPRRFLKPKVRWAVLQRDNHRCRACGKTAEEGAKLEVDHIIPVCAGGGDEMENLRVLCRACNRGKGTQKAA